MSKSSPSSVKAQIKALDKELLSKLPQANNYRVCMGQIPQALATLGISQTDGLMGLQMMILSFQTGLTPAQRAEFMALAEKNMKLFMDNEEKVINLESQLSKEDLCNDPDCMEHSPKKKLVH